MTTKRQAIDRDWSDYPTGTRAYGWNGGWWERVERGWQPNVSKDVFPAPGGDAVGACIELPATAWRGHLEIYPEDHCEVCGEIVHNHLDCPVCNTKFAPSKQYCDLNENTPRAIDCAGCNTQFQTSGGAYDPESVWTQTLT